MDVGVIKSYLVKWMFEHKEDSMKKQHKKSISIRIMTLILVISVVLIGVSLYTDKDQLKDGTITRYMFTNKVNQYRPLVQQYAQEYEVEAHVDVLLAMMMQESGGRGADPMQSSESLCGVVGCIDDPEQSIEQGVAYFSKNLTAANGDIELAVQAYNFGIGFVQYVQQHEDNFTQDLAIQFSQEMYEKAEDKSIYTCLREEAKEYDACYGDIYYARDVMKYKNNFVTSE